MIFQETARQGQGLLSLLCAGFAAGVLYDLMTPLRRRAPGAALPFLDIFWCLLSAALCLAALIFSGEDQARLYAPLGMACGVRACRLLVHWPLRALIRFLHKRQTENQEKRTTPHPALRATFPSRGRHKKAGD